MRSFTGIINSSITDAPISALPQNGFIPNVLCFTVHLLLKTSQKCQKHQGAVPTVGSGTSEIDDTERPQIPACLRDFFVQLSPQQVTELLLSHTLGLRGREATAEPKMFELKITLAVNIYYSTPFSPGKELLLHSLGVVG